jgi:hypothetical protein
MTGIACPQDGCDHVGDDAKGVMRHHREVHMGETYDFECEVRCPRCKAAGVVVVWLGDGVGTHCVWGVVCLTHCCVLHSHVHFTSSPQTMCSVVGMQVCHDKFNKASNLKRHTKDTHPDTPHAVVCEVRLMRALKLNYRIMTKACCFHLCRL